MTVETFDYAGPYRTQAKAEASLEDSFATGDIVEGERPAIRKDEYGRYWITLSYVT
jgi:hypothetical protein